MLRSWVCEDNTKIPLKLFLITLFNIQGTILFIFSDLLSFVGVFILTQWKVRQSVYVDGFIWAIISGNLLAVREWFY